MATNRLDILDDALIRPGVLASSTLEECLLTNVVQISGRIDRKIEFPNPNEKAREDILKIHVGGLKSVMLVLF